MISWPWVRTGLDTPSTVPDTVQAPAPILRITYFFENNEVATVEAVGRTAVIAVAELQCTMRCVASRVVVAAVMIETVSLGFTYDGLVIDWIPTDTADKPEVNEPESSDTVTVVLVE